MIFFDLEFFVPKEDRKIPGTKGTLVFNPAKPNHLLLGGYFISRRFNSDIADKEDREQSFWLWNFKSEKELLLAITDFFLEEISEQKNKEIFVQKKRIKDIVTCGFAISRIDLPVLYIRSNYHKLDHPENLFNIFLKTKSIDLSNVACFLFPNEKFLYPKTANEVNKHLFPKSEWKESGKNVWKYYDHNEFSNIEARCKKEVQEIIKIYYKIRKVL